MPKFSTKSIDKLQTCHDSLQELFSEVVKYFDCTILDGHRCKERQDRFFLAGKSKLAYPASKHNQNPSLAVDVAPYPIDWNDIHRFFFFAGYVLCTANKLKINIRWGGDWDRDTQVKDNTFNDLVHFEVIP